ncbi:hypothetical protein VMCG_07008 [Cytospora schulzeri]|uniref:Uncharacterized protein n=1 Tax=Cytospora schulzeri TaxID=448051 RepID=A0A423W3W4_9PEZI|nr:hypothetical protein VMCG_07008 [Valsa malicola]
MSEINRLHTNDLELGVTDAIQKHFTRQVVQRKPVSQRTLDFEHARPRWLRECMAEATGVFFYVFPGIASVAAFTLNLESPLGVTAFGSLFQIGWAFTLGIVFAIITCAPTSGGHFNPAITIALALWQGFPWKKVPYYIFSQIFGAFIAGLVLMGMYWPEIQVANEQFMAAGKPLVANGAPASILCSFPNPNQTNMGWVVMQEFFVDSFIAIPFVTPAAAPFIIGLAYGNMVWGFGGNTISTNLARDLGTRLVALIFYGREAFTYMGYTPVAILVNIPATLFATAYYEIVLQMCNDMNICASFNIYYERDPTLNPDYVDCPNPNSTTNIKCVFWGSSISEDLALNYGESRVDFRVVITGSNYYIKQAALSNLTDLGFYGPRGDAQENAIFATPELIEPTDGYPTYIGGYRGFYTNRPEGPSYDPSDCARRCNALTNYNSVNKVNATPYINGAYPKCNMFSVFEDATADGVPFSVVCWFFTTSWDSKYSTKVVGVDKAGRNLTASMVKIYQRLDYPDPPLCVLDSCEGAQYYRGGNCSGWGTSYCKH